MAGAFVLTNTISLPTVDIKNIASNGVNLLVLGNVFLNDPILTYSPSGQLLSTYQTGLGLGAIAWTGSEATVLPGASDDVAYQIQLPNGPNSGPIGIGPFSFPNGLGFDGTNLLVADTATGLAGVLTITLHELNPVTDATVGNESLVINTGTGITGTPVYDFAVHNGDLFIGVQGVNDVYEFSTGGSLLQTIPIPTTFGPRGIAFVGNNMFVADRSTSTIYELSDAPEPSALWLVASGILVLAAMRSAKYRQAADRVR